MPQIFLVVALCVLLPEPALELPAQSPNPDLVILNARVLTMNPKQPEAQAIAIRGDRIVWVGSTEAARKRFAQATRTSDLDGATVLPGFNDAHGHIASLGQSLVRLNLKDVPTEQEVVARLKDRVARAAPGEWIVGWGWDEGKWAEHYPTHHALTAAAPNNPVYFVGLHGFAAWVNRKALDLAGIYAQTRDPEQGRVVRDERTGEPSGILLNRAQELVARHIPPPTPAQWKEAIILAAIECVRNGLTSVHEARVSRAELQAFRELVGEERLPLRVYAMLDGADRKLIAEWLTRGPEIDPRHRLTVRSIKLFADGALGSRGAALFEPYSDAPQLKGVVTTSESEIFDITRRGLQKGFQVATHAIGDAANHFTLDAYERAMHEVSAARDARLRIEHAQVLAPGDVPRFVQLGVIPSMQPVHATSDMPWAEKRVGPGRILGAYAWRSLLTTGAHFPVSSDFPGETLNPFFSIYAALTRQDPQGNPPGGWHAEQKMTLDEVLRGYTREAAYAEFEERDKGSIQPGKLADLVVISGDITRLPPKEILSLRVRKTFVGGKLVFDQEKP